jgi:F-type H+-transporting ATPase subunit delta
MIALKTRARPYANALFELACEEDACAFWHNILATLSAIIKNADVQEILKIRSIQPKEWVTWIQSIKPELLGKKEIGNLLSLLAEKRRLFLLPEIFNLFEGQWRASKNEKRFTAIAPLKWDKKQSEQFHAFLNKRFACEAEVRFESDPDMLGGVKVLGEGWSLDYSARGWLEQLRAQLSS